MQSPPFSGMSRYLKSWKLKTMVGIGFACLLVFGLVWPASMVRVEYEAPFMSISMDAFTLQLSRTVIQDVQSPVAIPQTTGTENLSISVSGEDYRRIVALVEHPDFLLLENTYGAPESERFYPYRLTVTQWWKQKTVVFRSNPSWPGAPKAFLFLEQELLRLTALNKDVVE